MTAIVIAVVAAAVDCRCHSSFFSRVPTLNSLHSSIPKVPDSGCDSGSCVCVTSCTIHASQLSNAADSLIGFVGFGLGSGHSARAEGRTYPYVLLLSRDSVPRLRFLCSGSLNVCANDNGVWFGPGLGNSSAVGPAMVGRLAEAFLDTMYKA